MGGDVSVQAQDKTLVLCGWDARNTCSTYCNLCFIKFHFCQIKKKIGTKNFLLPAAMYDIFKYIKKSNRPQSGWPPHCKL